MMAVLKAVVKVVFGWLSVLIRHISFSAILFYYVIYQQSGGNELLMIVYIKMNVQYHFIGLLIEVILRRRSLLPQRPTIPKQPERS